MHFFTYIIIVIAIYVKTECYLMYYHYRLLPRPTQNSFLQLSVVFTENK